MDSKNRMKRDTATEAWIKHTTPFVQSSFAIPVSNAFSAGIDCALMDPVAPNSELWSSGRV
jgi:hypothetical protein